MADTTNTSAGNTSIIEVGLMGVQAGKTPLDASTSDGALLLDAWKSIIAAPRGPASIIWALEKGDQGKLWGWFEWESLRAHQEFAASLLDTITTSNGILLDYLVDKFHSFGGTATQRFGEVFTPGFTKHAFHSIAPLRSQVTQVLIAFFPAVTTQDAKDGVASSFERAQATIVEGKRGVKAVSAGWGMESDFPMRGRNGEAKGENGTVFFMLVGWEEMDEVEMEKVRENVASLVKKEGCVAWDEFLVECEILERAAG